MSTPPSSFMRKLGEVAAEADRDLQAARVELDHRLLAGGRSSFATAYALALDERLESTPQDGHDEVWNSGQQREPNDSRRFELDDDEVRGG